MTAEHKPKLGERVIRAAEAALAYDGYVSVLNLLVRVGWLPSSIEQGWRKGRIAILEEAIQVSPAKIGSAITIFRNWALAKGLLPSETRYSRASREGAVDLRFTIDGNPEVEKIFRTHYVSPAMPERKRESLEKKLSKDPQPVVFQIIKDSACAECGTEVAKNDLLFMEAGQPLCLACAKMADLEYLERGDAAITRRATKYSGRTAVVVRFSRSRGRYERQGILVERDALAKAEAESAEDAEDRAQARVRGREARAKEDAKLAIDMATQIQEMFPRIPPEDARRIAKDTARRGSGRIGRTAAGKKLDEHALTLAVRAAVRHNFTNYDELLMSGVERAAARSQVRERVDEIVDRWGKA